MSERIPLDEAIGEKLLFKDVFAKLSVGQRTTVKALYGLPLDEEEYAFWCLSQGSAEFDYLGYPTKIIPIPYVPKEYEELVCCFGRRSGKTHVASFITAYESLLGGHEDFIEAGQEAVILNISQQQRIAEKNLAFVRLFIEKSPLLKNKITFPGVKHLELANGFSVEATNPSLRSQRGLAIPVILADECNFWALDPAAANPDTEVERAVSPNMLQFPHSKKLWLSTPFVKLGAFYEKYMAGTQGANLPANPEESFDGPDEFSPHEDTLVMWAPTAAIGNPIVTRKRLFKEYKKEPDPYYKREYLAQFTDSVSNFLSTILVEKAIVKGRGFAELKPIDAEVRAQKHMHYVMALDPAFKHDTFALVVGHRDIDDTVYLDAIRQWIPEPGKRINPSDILPEIAELARSYGINVVHTDQHEETSFMELARLHNVHVQPTPWSKANKGPIYTNLQQMLNQERLALLDENLSLATKELKLQMLHLERKVTGGGHMQIAAPRGFKDDLVSAFAMMVHFAVTNRASLVKAKAAPLSIERDHVKIMEVQRRKEQRVQRSGAWDAWDF